MAGLSGLVAVPAPAFAAAPANDDFASAEVLTGLPASATGSSVDATKQTGEPQHADSSGGRSIWYAWTAQANGSVNVDLAGSSFDTLLAVYTGSAVDSLTMVAATDDAPGGSLQGRVSFSVTGGTTYWIAVDGYEGDNGSVEVSVTAPPPPSGSIAGYLSEVGAFDVIGLCADAYSAEGESVGQAVSFTGGYYEISGLPVGDYRVGFSDCGAGAYVSEFYDDVATYAEAATVSVVEDVTTSGIDGELVSIGSTGSIAGTVTGYGGSSLADVCVTAYSAEGVPAGDSVTGSWGEYRVHGLEAGDYRVEFSDCGSGALTEFYEDAATYADAEPVTVEERTQTWGIDAQLSTSNDPGRITGRVTDTDDNELEGVCVSASDMAGSTTYQYQTGADGRYEAEVPPGVYQVNFAPCGSPYPIEQWYDGATYEDAEPVTVLVGQETPGIDARMVIGGRLGGTVTDDTGAALRDVCVDLLDLEGDRVLGPVLTGRSGTYEFRDVVPDTYVVGFRNCRDVGPFADEFYEDASAFDDASPVAVSAGATAVADGVMEHLVVPNTVILTGPAASSTSASTSATFTFGDDPTGSAVSYMCQLDSDFWRVCESPKTYTGLSQSWHTFSVYAIGEGGLEDLTEATRSFRVDTVAPNTTVDSGPADDATVDSDEVTFEFHGAVGDTSKVQCKLDDGEWADCTSPASFEDLDEGEHTVEFRAEDAVENQDQTPASRTFTVDTVAPDTTIDSGPADDATVDSDEVTFEFHGTIGDTAKVQCKLDDGEWADCASPASFEDLDEGEHTVEFRAQDAVGHQDQTPASRTFTVDTVAPDTTIEDGPADGSTITSSSATFTFHGAVGDTAKVQCKLDNLAWADCTSPATFSGLTDAWHVVQFRAQDAVGNQDLSPASRTFRVQVAPIVPPDDPDTQAPDTEIVSGPEGVVALAEVSFDVRGSVGDTSRLECRLDDGAWETCTSPVLLTDLAEGEHTVQFRAVDAAGNADSTPAVRTFTVDTVAPDTTIDSGPSDGAVLTVARATFAFHGSAEDTATLQCRLDGGEWSDCASPMTFSGLAAGKHTVELRAVDAVGNTDASPASRTFRVDLTTAQCIRARERVENAVDRVHRVRDALERARESGNRNRIERVRDRLHAATAHLSEARADRREACR